MADAGNVQRAFKAAVIVLLTIVGVEWIHFRLGEPTLWDLARDNRISIDPIISGDDYAVVTENDFERYIQVLEAMQTDHDVSVQEAAESVELTLPDFRNIEARVQRDASLVERTRDLLRKKAEDLWDSRRAQHQG